MIVFSVEPSRERPSAAGPCRPAETSCSSKHVEEDANEPDGTELWFRIQHAVNEPTGFDVPHRLRLSPNTRVLTVVYTLGRRFPPELYLT